MYSQSTANVTLQSESERLTGRHIALLALLMACGFIVVGQLYVTIPMVAEIAARFGIEPAQAALIGTAFGMTYAAGFLLFGPLSDRFGRKRMILIGLPPLLFAFAAAPVTRRYGASVTARAGLLLAALALAVATIASPLAIGAASAILSAGVAFAVPGLIATVAGRATNANRGLALGIYSFALFLGASFASPVVQALDSIGTAPLWLLPASLLLAAMLAPTIGIHRPQSPASH